MASGKPNIPLSNEQRTSFEENGFLAIDELLDDADLSPLEAEYTALLERVATALHDAGEISSTSVPNCRSDRVFARCSRNIRICTATSTFPCH